MRRPKRLNYYISEDISPHLAYILSKLNFKSVEDNNIDTQSILFKTFFFLAILRFLSNYFNGKSQLAWKENREKVKPTEKTKFQKEQ